MFDLERLRFVVRDGGGVFTEDSLEFGRIDRADLLAMCDLIEG